MVTLSRLLVCVSFFILFLLLPTSLMLPPSPSSFVFLSSHLVFFILFLFSLSSSLCFPLLILPLSSFLSSYLLPSLYSFSCFLFGLPCHPFDSFCFCFLLHLLLASFLSSSRVLPLLLFTFYYIIFFFPLCPPLSSFPFSFLLPSSSSLCFLLVLLPCPSSLDI